MKTNIKKNTEMYKLSELWNSNIFCAEKYNRIPEFGIRKALKKL